MMVFPSSLGNYTPRGEQETVMEPCSPCGRACLPVLSPATSVQVHGAMSQVHLPCFVAKSRIIRTLQGHAQHSTATLPRDVQAFSQVSQAFSQVKVRL